MCMENISIEIAEKNVFVAKKAYLLHQRKINRKEK